jgi:hypothetical protein
MSDEDIADDKIIFYQRLLATDKDEAVRIVAQYLKSHAQEQLYDEVLLPALNYARLDRERGTLTNADERFIVRMIREIVTELDAKEETPLFPDVAAPPVNSPPPLPKLRILACPAKDQADEVALLMFRQLLGSKLYEIEVVGVEQLTSEVVAIAVEKKIGLVCIGALSAGAVAKSRHLCKRLRDALPKLKIVIGSWGSKDDTGEIRNSLLSQGAERVAISLLEARDQITNLRQLVN